MTRCSSWHSASRETGFFVITLVAIQLLLLSFALLSLRESALTSWVFAERSIAPTLAPIKAEE
jgi:hypothetical protein